MKLNRESVRIQHLVQSTILRYYICTTITGMNTLYANERVMNSQNYWVVLVYRAVYSALIDKTLQ